ncbi:MAG TPA: helix-turn-helix domain-containing protein [Terriglobales bacterium]|nr:helix-turn-helix domain-containing protein [Terriglobales bacterium]
MKRADLILHPVRLRIIQAFASDLGTRRLTPQQVSAALPDLPQASLYRHIERLHRGGVLGIASERRVRGAVERTYVLAAGGASLSAEDLANATREEQLGYFTTFAVGLITQFERYLQRPVIDLVADGVGYRQVVLNLSDEEVLEMAAALNGALARFLQHGPEPGRRRRTLATVLLPQDDT